MNRRQRALGLEALAAALGRSEAIREELANREPELNEEQIEELMLEAIEAIELWIEQL